MGERLDVFGLRERLVRDYADYTRSFVVIRDERISEHVETELSDGLLWPEPIVQLNPAFESGGTIEELVAEGLLSQECTRIFRRDKTEADPTGKALRLHRHQADAIRTAHSGANYVLTTGTGSGKSLTYIVPIVDRVLRMGPGKGIKAIVVYPMNALANSQAGELEKFLKLGYPGGAGPVTYRRYTGQESDEERREIIASPPDILLTNYVMLELILTRRDEHKLISAAQDLRFLVLDELHTYRGRQGADVALLCRRVREACNAKELQCIGTSATLAGPGTLANQREEVARVATLLFGAPLSAENVIGETLRRATAQSKQDDPAWVQSLRAAVDQPPPGTVAAFLTDPLASWIETTFGLDTEPETRRLRRATPRPITGEEGAADDLATLTGRPTEQCAASIRVALLAGYGLTHPDTGFPIFAFRVHQFFSRGETAYASAELPADRYLTTQEQQWAPDGSGRTLLPLAFCRECGQEYYTVKTGKDGDGNTAMLPRRLGDMTGDDNTDTGFLYISDDLPWPSGRDDVLDRLPDEWLEPSPTGQKVKSTYRDFVPRPLEVSPSGVVGAGGTAAHWLPTPFRFCLRCGISHGGRQPKDFGKLLTLGAGGRSSATTILSLAAIRGLRAEASLPERARKLLSFTDNRQDASLQAGHFNDFVEVGLIRSALHRATVAAGPAGLAHDELALKTYEALALPIELFAFDPEVRFGAREEVERTLRDVLGYRVYRDLERGWRITAPNLEQCGLLEIEYVSLSEVCAAEDIWADKHPALASASPTVRMEVAHVLLDLMRRELAVRVDYLTPAWLEQLQLRSNQHLIDPWAIDEDEEALSARILFPRSQQAAARERRENLYVSGRSGFGQYLRRPNVLPPQPERLNVEETGRVIVDLLAALRVGGLVAEVQAPEGTDGVPGYQLPASAMRWKAGDGTRAFHDPIRVPTPPESGGRTNPFFVEFYKGVAGDSQGIQAREHTAQVPPKEREEREAAFRTAALPVLFCSPTMELGVDIAELNVVNMRNVPPTPANYAQRSGRAGRSGQPALVFNYAAAGNSHDQFFFRRPTQMVAGQVKPPRLDLLNEDLVTAHVHAVWLTETGASLGSSLANLLDLGDDTRRYPLLDQVRDELANHAAVVRARPRARALLDSIPNLDTAEWYDADWLEHRLGEAALSLDHACDRWRELYRAAVETRDAQHLIVGDQSRPPAERAMAKRLRQQAETQIDLLAGGSKTPNAMQSDFYSYRYFASEGFLPGYSFPRLPLSAFIPARKGRTGRDEFLQRPRFLAITEFGPRSIVYHEGARYIINRVFLPVERDADNRLPTIEVRQCSSCGYLHPVVGGDPGPDLCELCAAPLDPPITSLFRLQNVSTKRRDRINSDEEERVRQGFEIRTGIRFAQRDGSDRRVAHIVVDGTRWGTLTYGSAATLWRINVGWTRRKEQNLFGFVLDTERGYWAKNEQAAVEDKDDAMSAKQERVVPYVEDRRNALLFDPAASLAPALMASLSAALKSAIQVVYDLEDSELAVEPLPNKALRNQLLLYEAAEGGAGVLRLLASDPEALSRVARTALELCHFDPDTGEDRHRGPGAREDCGAACYDCLLSYGNQGDHRLLDRHLLLDVLRTLMTATVEVSPGSLSRGELLLDLTSRCDTELERRFLAFLDEHKLELPTHAQQGIDHLAVRPDFTYAHKHTAVFVDGPVHEHPDMQGRDKAATDRLEDAGYTVIRIPHDADWAAIVTTHAHVFGAIE